MRETGSNITRHDDEFMDDDKNNEQDNFPLEIVPRNVTNTSTLASIVCVVAGTGILGIPHALSRSGWIGMLFLVLSALMAQFCGCLLIRSLYHGHSNRRRLSGFPEIGQFTFGKPGRIISILFSQTLMIFTPTLYIILASDNLSRLFLAAAGWHLSRKACTWIVAVAVGMPFVLVRSMRDVSFMSFFASMATVCLLLVITVVAASSHPAQAHHDWAIPTNIPIAFSTISFSYCGNVIFPHLEASMADPASWPKVLLVANFSVTVMYIIMGFMCYLVYGIDVQNPVYNSIAPGSEQNIAMISATIHVLLAVPMYLYVFTVTVESWLLTTVPPPAQDNNNDQRRMRLVCYLQQYPMATRSFLRIAEISVCALIAMVTPYFADFMSLIGTIAGEFLTFVLPCIFWIKLSWRAKGHHLWEIVLCALIAIAGTFCAVFGTVDAIKALIKDIDQDL